MTPAEIAKYTARNEFGDVTDLTYIQMVIIGNTGKTLAWAVIAKEGSAQIGSIRWFGRWRCYAFYPLDAIFEQKCLREIADFIEGKTKEHRQKRKAHA